MKFFLAGIMSGFVFGVNLVLASMGDEQPKPESAGDAKVLAAKE